MMNVFPEEGDGSYEHDYPYEVSYNTETGEQKTRKLTKNEISEIRSVHALPAEVVETQGGEQHE